MASQSDLARWFEEGLAAEKAEQFARALALYDAILDQAPAVATVHIRRGGALSGLERHGEALAAFEWAAEMEPGNAEAHYSMGSALHALDRLEEALAAYDATLSLDPSHEHAVFNRALALSEMGQLDLALAGFAAGARSWPNNPMFPVARAGAQLRRGLFRQGWADYAHRTRTWQGQDNGAPAWRGEPIAGKSLWVQAEQGLGDTIQFCRFASAAAQAGAAVTLHVQPRLVELMRQNLDGITVGSLADRPPSSDYQALLMGLPEALGTAIETIPGAAGYLRAAPDRVARWRSRIGEAGLKVGIAWQGEARWQGRRKRGDIGRSMPLAAFAPLAGVPGVRLISLQKNEGVAQLASLPSGMRVETLGADFDAGPQGFLDAVAVMACCDLVITSDTALAHLAGATGTRAWVALPKAADWRWFIERADSPWYASMQLFRQQRRDDWDTVFADIHAALAAV